MHEQRARLLRTELDRFIRLVADDMRPQRIILFGSLARGDVHEWSDLDLAVIMETDLPYFDRLKVIVQRVRPTVTTDLFVYTPGEWERMKTTSLFVRDEIVAKGKVVYEQAAATVA